MKPIRIFRHFECEGPGMLLDLIRARDIPFELVTIDTGMAVPPQTDDISGLIFMGGPMSVNDPLPWINDEIQLIQRAVAASVPVLGICLGSQLMAKAMGSRVYGGPCMEIGWLPVIKAKASAWTNILPAKFDVFHWHGETFDLPEGAEWLLRSDRVANQAFAKGPHLALQFHVEVTAPMINDWLKINGTDLNRRCYREHDAVAIRAAIPAKIAALHNTAHMMLGKWLQGCQATNQ